jgi:serine/threonine protein kinase
MRIPGFDILEKLGEGGMAVVWKAYQVSLDRIVAIKILRPQFSSKPEEVRDFILEARSAAKFKHSHIVQVYDVAEQDGTYYFVMEYVAGPTIDSIIEDEGVLPQKKALKITRCVAEALESAWNKARLIHRDIKPDNIMLDDDGTVKLADLGLAKMGVSAPAPSTGHDVLIEGTPNYMSPEQAQFSPKLDCRTDMYSLGAALYHMVTGVTPFDGYQPADTLQMHIEGHILNPRDLNPSITPGLAQFITKLMMKDPRKRYPTWTDVLTDLKKVSAGRILVTRASPDDDSTVAQPRTRSDAAAVVAPAASPIPHWFSIAAWVVLLLWWASCLYDEFRPLPPPQKTYASLSRPQVNAPAVPTEMPPILERAAPETAPQAQPGNAPANAPGDPSSQKADPASPQAHAGKADDAEQLETIGMNVANCLIAEDFNKALSVLQDEKDKPHSAAFLANAENIRKVVKEVQGMPIVLESAFKNKLDHEVDITLNKQKRRILIRAISRGTVNATATGGPTDGQSVTFSLSQLDPVEQSRWLGSVRTPSRYAMKFILLMKGRDYESAKALAGNCGPLASYFAKEVDARLQSVQ